MVLKSRARHSSRERDNSRERVGLTTGRQREQTLTPTGRAWQVGLILVSYALLTFLGWIWGRRAAGAEADAAKTREAAWGVGGDAWWIVEDNDDFYERRYVQGLSGVRDIERRAFFTGLCGLYRFNTSVMPSASVIVTVQNEQSGMLELTVHSILARTPPELLKQVIIVDDNGFGDVRGPDVNETELELLRAVSDKVIVLSNAKREGVARCRIRGAKAATGDVLVFVDSHTEQMSATWLQHLLVPIIENPRTLAAQTLDVMSDLDWTYGAGSGDLLYGVVNEKFWFAYQRSRFGGPQDDGVEREAPGRRVPYETPFTAGSLFAIRRDEFFRLGAYDEGMYVWGGENTDLAIKVWSCGGRIVMVPCSRVGHMYRVHLKEVGRWPPDIPQELTDRLGLGQSGEFRVHGALADNFTKIITRNNIRVMERWAGTSQARTGYYERAFGTPELPAEWQQFADEMRNDPFSATQLEAMRRNGCKSFDWFDRHVYKKLTGVHHPWHPDAKRTWI